MIDIPVGRMIVPVELGKSVSWKKNVYAVILEDAVAKWLAVKIIALTAKK
jgi:hypothetical protein